MSTLIEVLPQHRIDATAVASYLAPLLPPAFDGQLQVHQFQGGQSNPTYHLATNVGDWVLRKKPPGKLLPSAHAVEREFRVMAALQGSAVPLPRMLGLCEDASIIGTPFFVMQHVSGRMLGPHLVPDDAGTPAQRRATYDDLARVLAALHSVDWRAAGLADFGKPERFLERQVARWAAQWEASRTEDLPAMEKLREWLARHLPPDNEATLVHGDYRLGNVLIAPDGPQVAAVLDWELATLGHPLADVGYHCLMYHLPASEGGCSDIDLAAAAIPSQDEWVARYCEHAGRAPSKALDVFVVFSAFRLAAINAGVYKRALDGNASDPRAIQSQGRYRAVARLGWDLARRCGA
ncbi:MAG: phosphotransferase family protein [Burkholderiales bacterium]|nr:phosphotransferase family protein [Burkholderiales bacterium]